MVGVGLMIRVLGLVDILMVLGWEHSLVRGAVCLWRVRGVRSSVLFAQGTRMYGRVRGMAPHVGVRGHAHVLRCAR